MVVHPCVVRHEAEVEHSKARPDDWSSLPYQVYQILLPIGM
jgi:hypothetical protein